MAEELHVGAVEPIEGHLRNPDDSAFDLTGWTEIQFRFKPRGASTVTRKKTAVLTEVEIVGAETNGVVRHVWTAPDLVEGPIRYQWVVIKGAARVFFSPIVEKYVWPNL